MNTFLPTPSLVDFREVRCPKCHRLLLKVRGIAEISIVCHRCSSLVVWPALDLAIVVQEAQTSKVLSKEEFSTSAS